LSGLKEFQGRLSSRFSEKISGERIRLFSSVLGGSSSKAKGSPSVLPTLLTIFRKGEFEHFERMGLKLANVLHGEQVYHYETTDPIEAGDEVSFQTLVVSVLEKKGSSGRLSFLVFETNIEVTSPKPRKIGTAQTTIIVNDKSQGAASS
jgi:hypothetical protein